MSIQPDAREAILDRLLEVVVGVEGIVYAKRNDLGVSEKNLPCGIVLDGDEEVDPMRQTGSPLRAPIRARLLPEIVIGVQSKPEECGPLLSEFRTKVMKAVTQDATLIGLCSTNGGIRYLGYATDLGLGRAMLARISIKFGFDYMILPNRL